MFEDGVGDGVGDVELEKTKEIKGRVDQHEKNRNEDREEEARERRGEGRGERELGKEGRRGTNLEDEVIREDMLDGRNDVLHLGLGEFDRLGRALVNGSVVGELGHGGELGRVDGLRFLGGGSGSGFESGFGCDGCVHGFQRRRSYWPKKTRRRVGQRERRKGGKGNGRETRKEKTRLTSRLLSSLLSADLGDGSSVEGDIGSLRIVDVGDELGLEGGEREGGLLSNVDVGERFLVKDLEVHRSSISNLVVHVVEASAQTQAE